MHRFVSLTTCWLFAGSSAVLFIHKAAKSSPPAASKLADHDSWPAPPAALHIDLCKGHRTASYLRVRRPQTSEAGASLPAGQDGGQQVHRGRGGGWHWNRVWLWDRLRLWRRVCQLPKLAVCGQLGSLPEPCYAHRVQPWSWRAWPGRWLRHRSRTGLGLGTRCRCGTCLLCCNTYVWRTLPMRHMHACLPESWVLIHGRHPVQVRTMWTPPQTSQRRKTSSLGTHCSACPGRCSS